MYVSLKLRWKQKNAVRNRGYNNVRFYNCLCVYLLRSLYLCTALHFCLGFFYSPCRTLLNGGFPGGSGKEPVCHYRRHRFSPWVSKIPWRRKWQPTPIFLSEKSHGQRSLMGLVTKQLSFPSRAGLSGNNLPQLLFIRECLISHVLLKESCWI